MHPTVKRTLNPRDRFAGWFAPHALVLGLVLGAALALSGVWAVHRYGRGGYKPGPLPPSITLSDGALPSSWSLARYIVRIHYQGLGNSCVGQTGAAIEEITEAERHNRIAFSSGYLYNQIDGGGDNGASYDDMFRVLTTQGDAPLSVFPQDGLGDVVTQPGPAARAAAYPYRFATWRSILPSDRYTMEAEIHAGRPFAVAVPVYDSLYNNWNDTTIPTVTSQWGAYHFNHSMTAVGYDAEGIIILNSWGPTFGYHGLARLSWSFLQTVGAAIVVAQPQPYTAPKAKKSAFPVKTWGTKASYRSHGKVVWAARVWLTHRWLGHVQGKGRWDAKRRFRLWRFQHGRIYLWPYGRGVKVVRSRKLGGGVPASAACSAEHKQCRAALLNAINADRAARGLAPYTLDWTQSRGTTTCPGSAGHAKAMATSGSVWHISPFYPEASFPRDLCTAFTSAGENVGEGMSADRWQALAQIHQEMLNEGPGGGHFQNLMSSVFTRVGIGISEHAGVTYLTEDFLG